MFLARERVATLRRLLANRRKCRAKALIPFTFKLNPARPNLRNIPTTSFQEEAPVSTDFLINHVYPQSSSGRVPEPPPNPTNLCTLRNFDSMPIVYHARRKLFRRTIVVTAEGSKRRGPFATITKHPLQINIHGKSIPLTTTSRTSWVLNGSPIEPDADARLTDKGGLITVYGQELVLTARPENVVVTRDGEVVGRVAKKLSNGWFMAFSDVPDVVVMLCLYVVIVMKPRTR